MFGENEGLWKGPILRWSWLVLWNAIKYNKSAICGLLEPEGPFLRFCRACAVRREALGTRLIERVVLVFRNNTHVLTTWSVVVPVVIKESVCFHRTLRCIFYIQGRVLSGIWKLEGKDRPPPPSSAQGSSKHWWSAVCSALHTQLCAGLNYSIMLYCTEQKSTA